MIKNNFDRSSTGTDIEFNGCLDTGLSRMFFEENFADDYLAETSRYEPKVLSYIDSGYFEPNYNLKFKGNKDKAINVLVQEYGYDLAAVKTWRACELKQECLDNFDENPFDFGNWHDAQFNLPEWLVFENDIRLIPAKGYCQGDFVYIAVDFTSLKMYYDKLPKEDELRKEFEHLVYDCPISCHLDINGVDYHYNGDQYNFERDKWLTQVSKEAGVSIEALNNVVPNELDYR